jgi:hypothetical protein
MANITFKDNSIKVQDAMLEAAAAYLYEASGEMVAQTARNSRVDTGQTKGSWDYTINDETLESQIGSPLENAIWEEFGTGEYALEGNGRKGGWFYTNTDGEKVFTRGKKPNRALWKAFQTLKPKLIKRAESIFKELNNK